MTEHKTMNTIIHAAIRRDLNRFDDAFARFDGSAPRARQLKQAWDNLAYQLRHHHHDEETIFFPAFRDVGLTGELADELEGEHEKMASALDDADTAMTTFSTGPTVEQARAAREALAQLAGVTQEHLAHEERDLEPIAAANSQTPKAKQAQRDVRKAHKGNAGTFFAWLQDGADTDAQTGLRHEVPAPVLFIITRFAGRNYNQRIAPTWL